MWVVVMALLTRPVAKIHRSAARVGWVRPALVISILMTRAFSVQVPDDDLS
jgi:hypothetical protein